MKKSLLQLRLAIVVAFSAAALFAQAQTTISSFASGTNYTGGNGVSGNSAITFAVQNASGADIILTQIDNYLNTLTVVSPTNVTLWYSATSLSDAPTITAPNWTQIAGPVSLSVPATGLYTHFNGLTLLIPNGVTYRFAIQSSNGITYSGASPTPSPFTFTTGGVSLLCGGAQIGGLNVGYGGAFPSPVNNPRAFTGAITFVAAAACTGQPSLGNTLALDSVCPNASFSLGIQNSNQGTGVNYQWQSSPDGNTWTDIGGATSSSYNTSIATSTYYRALATCTNSSLSDTSTPKLVNVRPFTQCYCASNATNTADTKIDSVVLNGVAFGTSATTCETYTNNTGTPIPVQRTVNYPIRIQNGSCSGDHYAAYVGVYIDFNQDGAFGAGELAYNFGPTTALNTIPNGNISIPANAVLGTTRMRVVLQEAAATPPACGTYTYGETEDYLLDIQAAPVCSNPSVGGNAAGPDTVAANANVTFTLTGSNGFVQWQASASATGPWVNISGANGTTQPFQFGTIGTTYLRVFVTSPGCDPDSSNVLAVVVEYKGDNVCDAIPISIGTNGPYNTNLATVQTGEPAPPGNDCASLTDWCNNTLNGTLWFTLQAPASGRVSIRTPGTSGFSDTQIALWDANSCGDILTGGATLVAANDDDAAGGGFLFSSFLDSVVCLTPGKTYFLQLDAWGTTPVTTDIIVTDLGPGPDASFADLNYNQCSGGGIITLSPTTPGGSFFGVGIVQDTLLDLNEVEQQLGLGVENVIYYQFYACYTSTDTIVITPRPTITVDGTTNVSCNGGGNGAIDISVSGNGPFSYGWSNSATTEDVSGLTANDYSLTVTDDDGCVNTSSLITITEPTALTPSLDSVLNTTCFGASNGGIYISVSGGTPPYTYEWSDGSTNEDLVGVAAGIYTGTLSDALGCLYNSPQIPVTEPAQIVLSQDSVQNNNCFGGTNGRVYTTIQSGGVAPFTFAWSNGDATEDISALAAGVYILTVTDDNSCTSTVSGTVSEPAELMAMLDNQTEVSCNGGSNGALDISGMGGTGAIGFEWSNTAVTEDISNLTAGTYTVVLTDAANCTATASYTITEPTAISIGTSASGVNCFGGTDGGVSVNVSGGSPSYGYSWSNGSTTQNLTGVGAGSYTVIVLDNNSCSASASVTITEPSAVLGTSVTKTDQIQSGMMGSVDLTVTGGTSPYLYNWSNGATTQDLASVAAGTYTVTITDANGCSTTASATVGLIIGLDEVTGGISVSVYPNPTSNVFFVELTATQSIATSVEVYNVNGQLIKTGYAANETQTRYEIDMTNEAEGIYFAKVKIGAETIVRRIAVSK